VRGPNSLRILIADDHEVVRTGLKSLLSDYPGWTVCAEAVTGRAAVAKAEEHRPDIMVMDIGMPELNGLEATRKIHRVLSNTEILILSVHYSDQLLREVLDAGARAYVMKTDATRDLLSAIEALASHRSSFTLGAAQIVMNGFCGKDSENKSSVSVRNTLTPREREIVQLLAEGKSSKEVAAALAIRTKTAETHRTNIMRKLNMHSAGGLVRYAIKNYMIQP
jgi:DNA-binding NarL/FixJ family response regulator